MAFLIFFLAYPLGLGIWLSFTDTRIGRVGHFIGTENYEWLWDDSIFWLSVFNTLLYTFVASAESTVGTMKGISTIARSIALNGMFSFSSSAR